MVTLQILMAAIIAVESSGDPNAVGDGGAALGVLQIHESYAKDAAQWAGEDWTHEDAFDPEIAKEMFRNYMKRYAMRGRTGVTMTAEVIARIHNGGPDGWKQDATLPYWEKVKREIERLTNG